MSGSDIIFGTYGLGFIHLCIKGLSHFSNRGYGRACVRPGRIFMRRRALRQRPHLPPTGSSGLPWRWHLGSAGACRMGAGHRDDEADNRSRRRGRAAEPGPGRSGCRRCPRSGSRFGDGHRPQGIQRAGSGRRPCPGTRGGAGHRSPSRQAPEDAAAWSVRLPDPASR